MYACSDAQERADRVPDFRQKLIRTRSLLGVPAGDSKGDTKIETVTEDASSFDSVRIFRALARVLVALVLWF